MNATGYSSNLLASVTVAIIAGVAWCVKNKLKHSKCALHSGCIDIEAQEDSKTRKSVRDDIIDELKREGLYNVVMHLRLSRLNRALLLFKASA